MPAPAQPDRDAFDALVRARRAACVTYADWKNLDAQEVERGKPHGRPRVKFTTIEEMLAAIGSVKR